MKKTWGIVFECIFCGTILNIQRNKLGSKVSCPHCRNQLNFPEDFPYENIFYIKDKFNKFGPHDILKGKRFTYCS